MCAFGRIFGLECRLPLVVEQLPSLSEHQAASLVADPQEHLVLRRRMHSIAGRDLEDRLGQLSLVDPYGLPLEPLVVCGRERRDGRAAHRLLQLLGLLTGHQVRWISSLR